MITVSSDEVRVTKTLFDDMTQQIKQANERIRKLDLEREGLRISLEAARREKIPGYCSTCLNNVGTKESPKCDFEPINWQDKLPDQFCSEWEYKK